MSIIDKHPAPWRYDNNTGSILDSKGALVVSEIWMGSQGPEDDNGMPTEDTSTEVMRLVLAAPELLAALKGVLELDDVSDCDASVANARALIARIEKP